MQLAIPHHIFDTRHLHLAPFQLDRHGKQIARLGYTDTAADLTDVPLLTPPLRVVDFHSDRLRLDLADQPAFLQKMVAFHEYVVSTFYLHQQSFLGLVGRPYDSIQHLFYYLLEGTYLSVFLHPTSSVLGRTTTVADLRYGDTVRLLLRFHGISQVYGTMRLRIQHAVPCVWYIAPPLANTTLTQNRYEMLIRFDPPTAADTIADRVRSVPPSPQEHYRAYRPSEAITRHRPLLRIDARPFVSMIKRAAGEAMMEGLEGMVHAGAAEAAEQPAEPVEQHASVDSSTDAPVYRQFVPPEEGQRMCRFSPSEPRRGYGRGDRLLKPLL